MIAFWLLAAGMGVGTWARLPAQPRVLTNTVTVTALAHGYLPLEVSETVSIPIERRRGKR